MTSGMLGARVSERTKRLPRLAGIVIMLLMILLYRVCVIDTNEQLHNQLKGWPRPPSRVIFTAAHTHLYVYCDGGQPHHMQCV